MATRVQTSNEIKVQGFTQAYIDRVQMFTETPRKYNFVFMGETEILTVRYLHLKNRALFYLCKQQQQVKIITGLIIEICKF